MSSREHDVVTANVAHKMRVPTWKVHANIGEAPQQSVPVPGGPDTFPDVVAFEKYTGRLAAIGAVETAETLADAAAEWKLFALLAPKFFAYVPEECLEEAMKLCRRQGIDNSGLRIYYYNSRNQFVVERGWHARKRKAAETAAA
ncbi:MAG TPA: hypothetical protein VHR86_05300 [Armatimonadota bacterium]|nr:hypothetical protein [Armatimonadota bacterium]